MFNIDLVHERYCDGCHKLKSSTVFGRVVKFFKQAIRCDVCVNKQIAQKCKSTSK